MKVVTKVWGWEQWIANEPGYCGKILTLNRGYCCSLHFHKIKDETFYVLRGRVLLELREAATRLTRPEIMTFVLRPGEAHHVKPGDLHSFIGLEDSQIVEFSTHHEDSDSYRQSQSRKLPDEEFLTLLRENVPVEDTWNVSTSADLHESCHCWQCGKKIPCGVYHVSGINDQETRLCMECGDPYIEALRNRTAPDSSFNEHMMVRNWKTGHAECPRCQATIEAKGECKACKPAEKISSKGLGLPGAVREEMGPEIGGDHE